MTANAEPDLRHTNFAPLLTGTGPAGSAIHFPGVALPALELELTYRNTHRTLLEKICSKQKKPLVSVWNSFEEVGWLKERIWFRSTNTRHEKGHLLPARLAAFCVEWS
jgi:hypothetical protein